MRPRRRRSRNFEKNWRMPVVPSDKPPQRRNPLRRFAAKFSIVADPCEILTSREFRFQESGRHSLLRAGLRSRLIFRRRESSYDDLFTHSRFWFYDSISTLCERLRQCRRLSDTPTMLAARNATDCVYLFVAANEISSCFSELASRLPARNKSLRDIFRSTEFQPSDYKQCSHDRTIQ